MRLSCRITLASSASWRTHPVKAFCKKGQAGLVRACLQIQEHQTLRENLELPSGKHKLINTCKHIFSNFRPLALQFESGCPLSLSLPPSLARSLGLARSLALSLSLSLSPLSAHFDPLQLVLWPVGPWLVSSLHLEVAPENLERTSG